MMSKEAMKQALEALGHLWLFSDEAAVIANPAIAALREALAEQPAQEPDWLDKAQIETDWDHVWLLIKAASYASSKGFISGTTNWGSAVSRYIKNESPQPAQQEPVATKLETQQFNCFHVSAEDFQRLKNLPVGTKLYTRPQAREPEQEEPVGEVRNTAYGQTFVQWYVEMQPGTKLYNRPQAREPEQPAQQEPSNLHVMVGYSSVDNAYFVYEETAPNEYCKIKGPFSNKQVAETAMRDPNAPLIYTHAQPTQAPLTDEQIQEVVTKAVRERKLSWLGFKKDNQGEYTIPVLSPADYQMARAIEAAHQIGVKK